MNNTGNPYVPSARLSAAAWNSAALAGLFVLAAVGGPLALACARQARADTAAEVAARHLLTRATPEEAARVRARTAVLSRAKAEGGAQPNRPSDVVRAFHAAALAMHVDLVSIRPLPDPASEAAWTLHLEFVGAYNDVGFFLALIEQAPLRTDIRHLRLEPRTDVPGQRVTTGPKPLRGTAEAHIELVSSPPTP